MILILLVEPSHGVDPGHMVIGQESPDGETKYFGFHFDPDELPREFQLPERWQEFLHSHKTPGHIRDELTYVHGLLGDSARKHLEKRVNCEIAIETVILPHAEWDKAGDYSFNPDDFHSAASPCYNCVTWATMIGNKLIPGFIEPVRQGRMKLIVKQIRAGVKPKGGRDG
jgi:hypothetical protein